MPDVKIRGVVKFARSVKNQISQELHPQDLDELRQSVSVVVQQVEQICQQYKTSPVQLSQPTYLSYRFLKNLDFDHLPAPKSAKSNSVGNGKGFQAAEEEIQREFDASAGGQPSQAASMIAQKVSTFLEQFQKNNGANTASARINSTDKRRLLWLKYLTQPGAIDRHIQTIAAANQIKCQTRWLAIHAGSTPTIRIRAGNLAPLYRADAYHKIVILTLHEGFAGAPIEVIQAIVCAALGSRKKSDQEVIRRYARSDSFQQIHAQLHPALASHSNALQGKFFNLEKVFDRVNRDYFDGALAKPRLHWSAVKTYRKFGHYQPSTDIIQISRTLDQASTPAEVIDFVMYHEMLHKKLGAVQNGKRRIAHTPEFRQAERAFARAERAQAFLNEISTANRKAAAPENQAPVRRKSSRKG